MEKQIDVMQDFATVQYNRWKSDDKLPSLNTTLIETSNSNETIIAGKDGLVLNQYRTFNNEIEGIIIDTY